MKSHPKLIHEFVAEAVGTFALVFMGTGAAVANHVSSGAITHVGVAITFGAIVAAMIYTFGHVSGAQMNPAVTLGFWTSGALPTRKLVPYISAQLLGAVAASGLLWLSFGNVGNLGATLPLADNWSQSLMLEMVLTFVLMIVILGSGLDQRSPSGFAGIAIGLTVLLEAMCFGPITGASMNPARSFSPALLSGAWQHQWLYWVAPIVGAQLAVFVYRFIAPMAFPQRATAQVVAASLSGETHEH
jgi:MIP family channel proteins